MRVEMRNRSKRSEWSMWGPTHPEKYALDAAGHTALRGEGVKQVTFRFAGGNRFQYRKVAR